MDNPLLRAGNFVHPGLKIFPGLILGRLPLVQTDRQDHDQGREPGQADDEEQPAAQAGEHECILAANQRERIRKLSGKPGSAQYYNQQQLSFKPLTFTVANIDRHGLQSPRILRPCPGKSPRPVMLPCLQPCDGAHRGGYWGEIGLKGKTKGVTPEDYAYS
jgi:hypothetical protein